MASDWEMLTFDLLFWWTSLHGFAGMSYFVDQKTGKFRRNKSLNKRNGYKVLRVVIHCVLKFRFYGFKIAVNKVVTL